MPKLLIRIVALLLIPALLVDPALAAGLSAEVKGLSQSALSSSQSSVLSTQSFFAQEALMPALAVGMLYVFHVPISAYLRQVLGHLTMHQAILEGMTLATAVGAMAVGSWGKSRSDPIRYGEKTEAIETGLWKTRVIIWSLRIIKPHALVAPVIRSPDNRITEILYEVRPQLSRWSRREPPPPVAKETNLTKGRYNAYYMNPLQFVDEELMQDYNEVRTRIREQNRKRTGLPTDSLRAAMEKVIDYLRQCHGDEWIAALAEFVDSYLESRTRDELYGAEHWHMLRAVLTLPHRSEEGTSAAERQPDPREIVVVASVGSGKFVRTLAMDPAIRVIALAPGPEEAARVHRVEGVELHHVSLDQWQIPEGVEGHVNRFLMLFPLLSTRQIFEADDENLQGVRDLMAGAMARAIEPKTGRLTLAVFGRGEPGGRAHKFVQGAESALRKAGLNVVYQTVKYEDVPGLCPEAAYSEAYQGVGKTRRKHALELRDYVTIITATRSAEETSLPMAPAKHVTDAKGAVTWPLKVPIPKETAIDHRDPQSIVRWLNEQRIRNLYWHLLLEPQRQIAIERLEILRFIPDFLRSLQQVISQPVQAIFVKGGLLWRPRQARLRELDIAVVVPGGEVRAENDVNVGHAKEMLRIVESWEGFADIMFFGQEWLEKPAADFASHVIRLNEWSGAIPLVGPDLFAYPESPDLVKALVDPVAYALASAARYYDGGDIHKGKSRLMHGALRLFSITLMDTSLRAAVWEAQEAADLISNPLGVRQLSESRRIYFDEGNKFIDDLDYRTAYAALEAGLQAVCHALNLPTPRYQEIFAETPRNVLGLTSLFAVLAWSAALGIWWSLHSGGGYDLEMRINAVVAAVLLFGSVRALATILGEFLLHGRWLMAEDGGLIHVRDGRAELNANPTVQVGLPRHLIGKLMAAITTGLSLPHEALHVMAAWFPAHVRRWLDNEFVTYIAEGFLIVQLARADSGYAIVYTWSLACILFFVSRYSHRSDMRHEESGANEEISALPEPEQEGAGSLSAEDNELLLPFRRKVIEEVRAFVDKNLGREFTEDEFPIDLEQHYLLRRIQKGLSSATPILKSHLMRAGKEWFIHVHLQGELSRAEENVLDLNGLLFRVSLDADGSLKIDRPMAQLLEGREFIPLGKGDLTEAEFDWMTGQLKRALKVVDGPLREVLKGKEIEVDHYLHQLFSPEGIPWPVFTIENTVQDTRSFRKSLRASLISRYAARVPGMKPGWRKGHAVASFFRMEKFFVRNIVAFGEELKEAFRKAGARTLGSVIGVAAGCAVATAIPGYAFTQTATIHDPFVVEHNLVRRVVDGQGDWVAPTRAEQEKLAGLRTDADTAYNQAFNRWGLWGLSWLAHAAGFWAAFQVHRTFNKEIETNGIYAMKGGEQDSTAASAHPAGTPKFTRAKFLKSMSLLALLAVPNILKGQWALDPESSAAPLIAPDSSPLEESPFKGLKTGEERQIGDRIYSITLHGSVTYHMSKPVGFKDGDPIILMNRGMGRIELSLALRSFLRNLIGRIIPRLRAADKYWGPRGMATALNSDKRSLFVEIEGGSDLGAIRKPDLWELAHERVTEPLEILHGQYPQSHIGLCAQSLGATLQICGLLQAFPEIIRAVTEVRWLDSALQFTEGAAKLLGEEAHLRGLIGFGAHRFLSPLFPGTEQADQFLRRVQTLAREKFSDPATSPRIVMIATWTEEGDWRNWIPLWIRRHYAKPGTDSIVQLGPASNEGPDGPLFPLAEVVKIGGIPHGDAFMSDAVLDLIRPLGSEIRRNPKNVLGLTSLFAVMGHASKTSDRWSVLNLPDWMEKYVVPLPESVLLTFFAMGWVKLLLPMVYGLHLSLSHPAILVAGIVAFVIVSATIGRRVAVKLFTRLHGDRREIDEDELSAAHLTATVFAALAGVAFLLTRLLSTHDVARLLTLGFELGLMMKAYALVHSAIHFYHNITHVRHRRWGLLGNSDPASGASAAAPELPGHYEDRLYVRDIRTGRMVTLRYVHADELTDADRQKAYESLRSWRGTFSNYKPVKYDWMITKLMGWLGEPYLYKDQLAEVRFAISPEGEVEGYLQVQHQKTALELGRPEQVVHSVNLEIMEIAPDNLAGIRYQGVGKELFTAALYEAHEGLHAEKYIFLTQIRNTSLERFLHNVLDWSEDHIRSAIQLDFSRSDRKRVLAYQQHRVRQWMSEDLISAAAPLTAEAILQEMAAYNTRTFGHSPPTSFDRAWISQEAAMVRSSDSILHLGAGLYRGNIFVRFSWIVEAALGAKVLLTDIVPEELSPHKEWLASDSWLRSLASHVQFDQRPIDCNQLVEEFHGQRFNQIEMLDVFSHGNFQGNPSDVLQQIFKLLAPGGRIIITDDYARLPKRTIALHELIPEVAAQSGYVALPLSDPMRWVGGEHAKVLTYRIEEARQAAAALDKQSIPSELRLQQNGVLDVNMIDRIIKRAAEMAGTEFGLAMRGYIIGDWRYVGMQAGDLDVLLKYDTGPNRERHFHEPPFIIDAFRDALAALIRPFPECAIMTHEDETRLVINLPGGRQVFYVIGFHIDNQPVYEGTYNVVRQLLDMRTEVQKNLLHASYYLLPRFVWHELRESYVEGIRSNDFSRFDRLITTLRIEEQLRERLAEPRDKVVAEVGQQLEAPLDMRPVADEPKATPAAAPDSLRGFNTVAARLQKSGIDMGDIQNLESQLLSSGVRNILGIKRENDRTWIFDIEHARYGRVCLKIAEAEDIMELLKSPAYRARLTLLQQNTNQHIQDIFDFGTTRILAWWVEEWVPGESLDELLKHRHTLSPAEIDIVLHGLIQAGDHLKGLGLKNPDLNRPSNLIVLSDAETRITQVKSIDVELLFEDNVLPQDMPVYVKERNTSRIIALKLIRADRLDPAGRARALKSLKEWPFPIYFDDTKVIEVLERSLGLPVSPDAQEYSLSDLWFIIDNSGEVEGYAPLIRGHKLQYIESRGRQLGEKRVQEWYEGVGSGLLAALVQQSMDEDDTQPFIIIRPSPEIKSILARLISERFRGWSGDRISLDAAECHELLANYHLSIEDWHRQSAAAPRDNPANRDQLGVGLHKLAVREILASLGLFGWYQFSMTGHVVAAWAGVAAIGVAIVTLMIKKIVDHVSASDARWLARMT